MKKTFHEGPKQMKRRFNTPKIRHAHSNSQEVSFFTYQTGKHFSISGWSSWCWWDAGVGGRMGC